MVVDASALIEVLLRTPGGASIEKRLFEPGQTLHAPHLIDVEVAQVIRRYAARGDIDSERGEWALNNLAAMRLQRYPHDLLLPRVWELRNNDTACDAVYIALAEALDARFSHATSDSPAPPATTPECNVPKKGNLPIRRGLAMGEERKINHQGTKAPRHQGHEVSNDDGRVVRQLFRKAFLALLRVLRALVPSWSILLFGPATVAEMAERLVVWSDTNPRGDSTPVGPACVARIALVRCGGRV